MKTFFLLLFSVLAFNAYSQSFVQMKDGRYMAIDVKFQDDSSFTVNTKDMGRLILNKSDLVFIEFDESGVVYYDKSYITPKTPTNNYEQGASVYVPLSSDRIAGRAGRRTLKNKLQEDGYWKVVNCELEADFVALYFFSDAGVDHANVKFRTRDGKLLYQSPDVKASDFVPAHAGQESADKIVTRYLIPLQTQGNSDDAKKSRRRK